MVRTGYDEFHRCDSLATVVGMTTQSKKRWPTQTWTVEAGPVELVGALDLDRSGTGVVARRLPAWTRPQIPDLIMDAIVQLPSGVRLRFTTDSTTVELDVMLTLIRRLPGELRPAVFDLVVDGTLADQATTTTGTLVSVTGTDPDSVTFEPGEPTTVRFAGLPAGPKAIEVWLPQATAVELRDLQVDHGTSVQPAPPPTGRRWVHYGSSISHCFEADSPTGTWPAIAARRAHVELCNLGFAGQCMLDPFVARTIRDLDVDVISTKVGINVVNGDTLRDRTFGPALHGLLDTVREGHPDTPLLVVSPIHCPSAEDSPGPTVTRPDGTVTTVPGLDELRTTSLTLRRMREMIAAVVQTRRDLGDTNLHHLDGLELFGAADVDDLPDGLHPNADGYRRMGERFASLAFGEGGALH
jgi:hypothetical protein